MYPRMGLELFASTPSCDETNHRFSLAIVIGSPPLRIHCRCRWPAWHEHTFRSILPLGCPSFSFLFISKPHRPSREAWPVACRRPRCPVGRRRHVAAGGTRRECACPADRVMASSSDSSLAAKSPPASESGSIRPASSTPAASSVSVATSTRLMTPPRRARRARCRP